MCIYALYIVVGNKVVFYETSPVGADIILLLYVTMSNAHRYFDGPDTIMLYLLQFRTQYSHYILFIL